MSDIFINTFNPEREIQGERQSQPKRLAETAGSSELSSTALEEKPSVVKIFFNEYMYTYTHKNAYQMMLTPAAHVHLFLKIFFSSMMSVLRSSTAGVMNLGHF